MKMNTLALAAFGSALLASTVAFAEPSTHYSSLAKAVQGVKADCSDNIHDPHSTSFIFPPKRTITLARCRRLRGNLCWVEAHAMGGRWERELICTRGSVALGGFPSTYKQGQNR